MKHISLDPRVNRMELETPEDQIVQIDAEKEGWITYEVFHQKKTGTQHIHAGIVHAPSDEMALVFAKEQFARRGATTGLWVVKSANIVATLAEDAEVFETTPEKLHREPSAYKVRDKIENYKKQNEQQ